MKKYASQTLKLISWVYIGFPVFYLLCVATLFRVPYDRLFAVILMPLFVFVSIVSIVAGRGLYDMRRWAWYVFGPANIFVLYLHAWVVTSFSESPQRMLSFLLSSLAIALIVYRVARELRVPYFLPKIRWWESNPDYRLEIPISISHEGKFLMEGEILDLAMSGCFIRTIRHGVIDSEIRMRFTVFGIEIECPGKIVWLAESTVTHPRGLGVRFKLRGRRLKKKMRAAVDKIRDIERMARQGVKIPESGDFYRYVKDPFQQDPTLLEIDEKEKGHAPTT